MEVMSMAAFDRSVQIDQTLGHMVFASYWRAEGGLSVIGEHMIAVREEAVTPGDLGLMLLNAFEHCRDNAPYHLAEITARYDKLHKLVRARSNRQYLLGLRRMSAVAKADSSILELVPCYRDGAGHSFLLDQSLSIDATAINPIELGERTQETLMLAKA